MKKKIYFASMWIRTSELIHMGGMGNTAETVYDGTVELSFTLVYSLDSLILAD